MTQVVFKSINHKVEIMQSIYQTKNKSLFPSALEVDEDQNIK